MINQKEVSVECEPRTSLLDLLREHVGLTGTKKGCNQGACGACTVLADGKRINACLALAVQYEGVAITTIEGIGTADAPHPLQAAFMAHDGFQCGYCTPGQICSAIGMAAEAGEGLPSFESQDMRASAAPLSKLEIRERMSGNLCRCGAHNGIVDAIAEVYGGAL
nr:2Fe-2S iron-sulfur cluster-binding protein [Luteimonas abyssi]